MRTLKYPIALLLLTATLCSLAAAAPKQKVLFDCDLAGDVDDAFALALVLASPELDVLGVVLDHGDTAGRARVACRMLYETGRENIPVVVGRPTPGIVGEQKDLAEPANQFAWGEGFGKLKPSKENAAEFIIKTLRKHRGEVILFTVGPVCNMEDVLKKDPAALKNAKRVVSMFGSFRMGYDAGPVPDPEWNVRADIGAARRFLASAANPVLAGLDVTTFVKLNEENRTRLLYRNSPLTDAVCGLYTLWRYEGYAKPDPTLFDAVAVGMVLWPELFTKQKVHVTVDDRGYTRLDGSLPPNCEIGVTIKQDEFIRRMMERLLKQNLMSNAR